LSARRANWDKPELPLTFYLNGNQHGADSLVWQAKQIPAVDVKTTTMMPERPIIMSVARDFIKADIKGAAAPHEHFDAQPSTHSDLHRGSLDHPAELTRPWWAASPRRLPVRVWPCVINVGSILTDVMFFR
jgi:hypothetical protein